MSRVGKYPVTVPTGVQVSITGGTFLAKGKFGELGFKLSNLVKATFDNSKVIIQPLDNSQQSRMMWGTTRALVANIVTGVSVGYTKILEIEGTGFRAALQGKDLIMNLGFSHDVVYEIPKGVKIVCEKPTLVKIEGADKRLVGQVAVEIQSFRPPEPYKGKGIKFEGKPILRKEGKKK